MNIPYLLFGKSIKRKLEAGYFRPKDFTGMEYAFVDNEGHEYYSWPSVENMPTMRLKEIEALMTMVDSGRADTLMKEVANALIEQANLVVTSTAPKAKNAAAASIATLAKELIFRKDNIIPEEAYYALASVCCARRDEDPAAMDRVIHEQKIKTFRRAGRAGRPFFQASGAFKGLLGPSLSSEDAFLALRISWTAMRERHKMVLAACV